MEKGLGKQPHMKGYYLSLTEGTDGEIKAALPVLEVSSWILGKRLISIPFATICDPLVTGQEEIQKLLEETFNLSKRLGTSCLEIRTLQSHPLIQENSFYCSCFYKHHYLELTKDINNELHRRTRRKHGLPPQPYEFFKQLWNTFALSRHMKLLLAKKDGTTIAALILFMFKDRVSAEFLAWDDGYFNLSPNHLFF